LSLALPVIACSGALLDAGGNPLTSDSDGGQDAPPQCAPGQRIYNGICRQICTSSTNCPAGSTCVAIDQQSLCLDGESGAHCAYLESDAQCLATGGYYYYGVRGQTEYVPYESYPPYANPYDTTPYTDPNFVPTAPYPFSDEYSATGCTGDATWKSVPLATDPGCTATHAVVRCRRLNNRCMLVPGTTHETPSP
jgi:hypothetical protein